MSEPCCPQCGARRSELAEVRAGRVARRYGFDLADLQRRDQRKVVCRARMLAAASLRRAGCSLREIANVLHRDRSTVLHAIRTAEARAGWDTEMSA